MNINGVVPFPVSRQMLWSVLVDPDQLSQCLPGLEEWWVLEPQRRFKLHVRPQLAPSGARTTIVPIVIEWTQLQPQEALAFAVEILWGQQRIEANGRFTLNPCHPSPNQPAAPPQTELHFAADIHTPNKALEQMMRNLAPPLIDRYFARLQAHVQQQQSFDTPG